MMFRDGAGAGPVTDMRARRAAEARRARRLAVALSALFAVAAIVLLAVLALVSGAPGDDAGDGVGLQPGATPAAQAALGGEGAAASVREVTDSLGRTVAVPEEPLRIAVFDSFCGEMAIMAGAGDRIVGLPAGVRSDAVLMAMEPALAPGALALSGNAVNIETLVDVGCDVALVKTSLSEDERAKLDAAGIPYVAVGYVSVDEQLAAMRLVGAVCGGAATEKAERLAAYYEEVLASAAERTEALAASGAAPVRVYHSINDALLTDGDGSLGADWIARVGCVDVSAGELPTSGTDYNATLEQIYVWQPDMIVCNAADAAAQFRQDAAWASLAAVRAGEVHVIPTGATRWGQRGSVETYLAMLWLGCTAYPQAYADVDLRQVVDDYYRDFFGIEVTDELWEQMTSGIGIRDAGSGDGSGAGSGGGR